MHQAGKSTIKSIGQSRMANQAALCVADIEEVVAMNVASNKKLTEMESN